MVNGVTFDLAPSTVAPGGIFNVYGFNLAPSTVLASKVPLPTSLGSPAVEVLVNGRPAPLYFVSATQINAQTPWETEPGAAQVVVRRGGVSSRPATLMVQVSVPSLFALNGAGFGPAIAVRAANGRFIGPTNPPAAGDVLTLYASGLGPVEPAVPSGAEGPSPPLSRVMRPQRAMVSGYPARVLFAGLAPTFVGLFQINLQLPEQVAAGDVLQYFSGPRMANRLTIGSAESPRLEFLPLAEGAGNVAGIVDSDMNGGFVAVNGRRGDDGCFQSVFLFDFRRGQTTQVGECLIAANANAQSPFVSENGTARLGALIGPPVGTAPAGISSKVLIVDAAREPLTIELPSAASTLVPAGAGNTGLMAVLPGEPPRVAFINTETGEVQVPPAGDLPIPGVPVGRLLSVNVDGLTQMVSGLVVLSGNRLAVVVADSESNPQRAVLAVLSPNGEVGTRIPFPEAYLPLMPPAGTARPGQAPPGGAAPPTPRASAVGEQNRVLVLARSRDGSRHAVVTFDLESASARPLDFPAGVFAAACSPAIRLVPLTLGQRVVVPMSDRLETAVATPCAATGLVVYDLAGSGVSSVTLPENGTLDVNSLGVLNDFLYGANADRLSQNPSSLFVFDGADNAIRKLDTPTGASAFAGLQPIAVTGQLLALATNRQPGDEGLILFDLARGTAKLFPVPAGFARAANQGMHLATRKLTARGIKAGAEGSQCLIYDPATGAVTILPNPAGVQAIGSPAAQAQQARLVWMRNPNADTIVALTFAGDDRLTGLALLQTP